MKLRNCRWPSCASALAFPTIRSAVLHAQTVDTKAAAAAIMQADRDFNQSVATRDKKKFLSLISEMAVFVGDGPLHGHDEILKGWAAFFDPTAQP